MFSLRQRGMASLPVELLTRIFVLGTASDYPYTDSSFLLKPDEENYTIPSYTFQLLVSHVCRHWRNIALQTPALWSFLHFREPTHILRAEAFLARCKAPHLLNIIVNTVSVADHIPGVTLCRDEIHTIFKLITPHVKRWRAFHLKICDNECKGAARLHLSTCGPAPCLETLQLYHFEDYRTAQNLYLATYRPPVMIFDNVLPRLINVSLIGVNLPWAQSPYLVGLRDLQLALHSDNIRPPYEYWDSMLRNSPTIQRVSLHYSGPRNPNGEAHMEWPSTKDRLILPSLRDLSITDLDPDYVCLVMKRLVLPGVKALTLGMPDQDYTPFMDLLTVGDADADDEPRDTLAITTSSSVASTSASAPSNTQPLQHLERFAHRPFPLLSSLDTLAICALECSPTSWHAFLSALEGLRFLEMHFARIGDELYGVLMQGKEVIEEKKTNGDGGSGASNGVEEEERRTPEKRAVKRVPLLPRLETFKIGGLSGDKVAELIQYREGEECNVQNWVVRWVERWKGMDTVLDGLVEKGWEGENGQRVAVGVFCEDGDGDEDEEAEEEDESGESSGEEVDGEAGEEGNGESESDDGGGGVREEGEDKSKILITIL